MDLYDIVLKIRLIAIKFHFLLHIPHISGTRMIQSGVGDLSCGEILMGQLQTPVEELMIFHRSPFKRMYSLSAWFSTCIVTPLRVTKPEYWLCNAYHSNILKSNILCDQITTLLYLCDMYWI